MYDRDPTQPLNWTAQLNKHTNIQNSQLQTIKTISATHAIHRRPQCKAKRNAMTQDKEKTEGRKNKRYNKTKETTKNDTENGTPKKKKKITTQQHNTAFTYLKRIIPNKRHKLLFVTRASNESKPPLH